MKQITRQKFALAGLAIALAFALLLSANGARAAEPRVVDYAGLLTESERADLEKKCASVLSRYKVELVVLTSEDLGKKSSRDYADDFYDSNGYGVGEGHDGALILIDMQNRNIWISTTGSMMERMAEEDFNAVLDAMEGYMSNGEYARGLEAGLDGLGYYAKSIQNPDGAMVAYDAALIRPERSLSAMELGVSLGSSALASLVFAATVAARYAGKASLSKGRLFAVCAAIFALLSTLLCLGGYFLI